MEKERRIKIVEGAGGRKVAQLKYDREREVRISMERKRARKKGSLIGWIKAQGRKEKGRKRSSTSSYARVN